MTSKITSPVRFVRCPKCRKVLPEPPEVLVYVCGGCGTKLQAKKRNNPIDDTTSQKLKDDSSGKRKMEQVSDDQEAGSSSNPQLVIKSIDKPEQNSDRNNLDWSNKAEDAGKKVENGTVDGPSDQVQEYSAIQMKMKQLSDDEKVYSSSHRLIDQNDPRSSTELSGHDQDPESSPEALVHKRMDQKQEDQEQEDEEEDYYPNAANKQENVTVDASSVGFEHSAEKQKMDKLSDAHETGSSFNQLLLVSSINEENHNSFEDHETSPEATFHNRSDQDLNDQEFLSCRKGTDFEESSSEFEDAFANTKIVRDSDDGSKSSFKSMIAEKLLDTRQKKPVYLDEDDILSDDGSADLHHRRRFDRISSVETSEKSRFGGTSYYGYEGSESSFDGNENNIPRKNRINRRSEFHPLNVRSGKNQHHSTDVRSLYRSNEFHTNPRHRSTPMIPENPKMERIELLKMVRELQDQLERTNVSNVAPPVPPYYNHILNNQGRYGQRMAFSGEQMAMNGRRDGNLCHHCCPQDRRFSAQLPRQHVCSNGPHYAPNTYYNPQFSGPSSPKLLSESEFSAPDDLRYRKPYRSPMKKRYVRPISGGSPWITCYRCSELLQLPQSFLVLKRKCHSLKCGACFKVLNFTLSNGTHVSRYYPEETIVAPPSSEVEDNDKSTRSRADPVSCSDRSFQKSYSTETDRNGSRELSEEKKKATMLRDTSNSTRASSSKVSGGRKARSEIEEVGDGHNGSPLHWLMGYPSPSKVIRG